MLGCRIVRRAESWPLLISTCGKVIRVKVQTYSLSAYACQFAGNLYWIEVSAQCLAFSKAVLLVMLSGTFRCCDLAGPMGLSAPVIALYQSYRYLIREQMGSFRYSHY